MLLRQLRSICGRRGLATVSTITDGALQRCQEFIQVAQITREIQAEQSDYTTLPTRFQVPKCVPWPMNLHGKLFHVSEIRRYYKTGMLPDNVVQSLNDVRFIWDVNEHNWNMKILALTVFKTHYGHTNVPFLFIVPENDEKWPKDTWNMRLGSIVHKLLKEAHESKRIANQILTKPTPRQQQLIELEFDWSKLQNPNPR